MTKNASGHRVPLPIDDGSAQSVAAQHIVKELPFAKTGFAPFKTVHQNMRVKKGKSRNVTDPVVSITASYHVRMTAAVTAHMHNPPFVTVDCNVRQNIIRIAPEKREDKADFKLSYSAKGSHSGSAIFSSRTLLAGLDIPVPGKLIPLNTMLYIEDDGTPVCYAQFTDEILERIMESAKEREAKEAAKAAEKATAKAAEQHDAD